MEFDLRFGRSLNLPNFANIARVCKHHDEFCEHHHGSALLNP